MNALITPSIGRPTSRPVFAIGIALFCFLPIAASAQQESLNHTSNETPRYQDYEHVTGWSGQYSLYGIGDGTFGFGTYKVRYFVDGSINLQRVESSYVYPVFRGAFRANVDITCEQFRDYSYGNTDFRSETGRQSIEGPIGMDIGYLGQDIYYLNLNGGPLTIPATGRYVETEQGRTTIDQYYPTNLSWRGPAQLDATYINQSLPREELEITYETTEIASSLGPCGVIGGNTTWTVKLALQPHIEYCGGQPFDAGSQCCVDSGVIKKYPIADLAACPNRTSHAGHVPQSNGCGTPRSQFDQVQFGVNILPACDEHDLCYDTCNVKKDACDDAFARQVLHLCTQEHGSNSLNGYFCLIANGLDVVFNIRYIPEVPDANYAYEAAQRRACDCCE